MKASNLFFIWTLLVMAMLISCEKNKDVTQQTDKLDEFGILGKWKLQTLTINGITDMSVRYDAIEFKADDEHNDLKGKFTIKGTGFETHGQFELDPIENIVDFAFSTTQRSYTYQILDDTMSFTYTEDSSDIIETWKREE